MPFDAEQRGEQPGRRLALTPPMGWMSWNAFGRDLDESAVLGNADAIVASGMRDAGYEYVCLDDHWHGPRSATGELRADAVRFPHGIPWLADQLHARGLRLGIYTCAGSLTCGGEPGSEGFEELDAATFAAWGVDYVKEDYCHAPPDRLVAFERYRRMGQALARSGRPIVFAVCEWGRRAPWEWAASVGAHLWRTAGDIQDDWSGAAGILAVADVTEPLGRWAGPGRWNDPDMLVAGLKGASRKEAAGSIGCTDAEYRTQICLWAMLAAALFASCDLRLADAATIEMLTAPVLVAIDQDPLGRPGGRTGSVGPCDIWERALAGGSRAIAVVNRADQATSVAIEFPPDGAARRDVIDAWTGERIGQAFVRSDIAPHGTLLYRVDGETEGGTVRVRVV